MEFISPRVSTDSGDQGFSVVISSRLPRWQEGLLITWLIAWTLCGVALLDQAFSGLERELRVPMLVIMVFWSYFEVRIFLVVLWRTKGYELWQLKEGEFTIKNSLFGYGRAHRYFVANMQRFGLLNMDETSWKWQMSDSFWTRGAERLGFSYLGKQVAFGRGLTKEEADKLAHVVGKELKRERKAQRQPADGR